MAERIQRSRQKGWRMPEGAIYVGRPSRWGNPFTFDGWQGTFRALALGCRADRPGRQQAAVRLYRLWLTGEWRLMKRDTRDWYDKEVLTVRPKSLAPTVDEIRAALAGKDLACWCPLVDKDGNAVPCHADVLLELANAASAPG